MNTMMSANMMAAGDNVVLVLTLVLGPLLLAYGVFQLVADLRGSAKKKIVSRLKGKAGMAKGTGKLTAEELRRTTKQVEGALGKALGGLSATARLQSVLEQANLPWGASQVLVNLTLAASVLMAGVLLAGIPLLAALGVGLAVYVLPIYYFMWRRKRRLKRFVNQLPDVFDLLGQALRAGHSLASGMQLVATELPDPAGTEFARVFQEQNLGLKIEDALQNLANRMDVLDVRFFVTAVLIQRQTGGDLGEILDKISGVIRDRIKLHGTVLALTAEGRLSGYVLLALPVVVFFALLYINTEYIMTLIHHPTGQMMLTTAVVMMVMGYVMIQKIVNIKV